MTNGLLTELEARELLAPYIEHFRNAIELGWQAWESHPTRSAARKRTRANVIHDAITNELYRLYHLDDRVQVEHSEATFRMSVDGRVTIMVKKLRRRGLSSSGILTNARLGFLHQAGLLEGTPVTSLVLGYMLDELELGVERAYLTCPLGRRNLWTIDLTTTQGATVTLFDFEEPTEQGTTVRSAIAPTEHVKNATEE